MSYFSFDKPREACGVFGIFAPGEDVARITYFGLYALQHRGQESAGIVVSTPYDIICYKDMGLVTQVFSDKILSIIKGDMAIGHVRYSTTGSSVNRNAQPIVVSSKRKVAVAHNGNLVNTKALRDELIKDYIFESTTDTEIIAKIIADSDKTSIEEAVLDCMAKIKGAYSVLVLSENKIIAFRDPYGIRPLCIGKINDNIWLVASETCALNIVGAAYIRDVEPGEVVIIEDGRLKSIPALQSTTIATCVFEFIYFARPDSYILGKCLHKVRKNMGRRLAQEAPSDGDIVISVPDSGTPAAIGYSAESKIPYDEGLIKNRYVGRTFINPDQRIRALGIKIKLNPLRDTIRGKKVVLVDDSIVRGTTSSQIVNILYECGAKSVHLRVSSPPVKHPCYYGIDTANKEELIASKRNTDNIKALFKCSSLAYLSIEGLLDAIDLPSYKLCTACFSGDYPISIPQQLDLGKFSFENENRRPEDVFFRTLLKR